MVKMSRENPLTDGMSDATLRSLLSVPSQAFTRIGEPVCFGQMEIDLRRYLNASDKEAPTLRAQIQERYPEMCPSSLMDSIEEDRQFFLGGKDGRD
jgi:hypothetical protein